MTQANMRTKGATASGRFRWAWTALVAGGAAWLIAGLLTAMVDLGDRAMFSAVEALWLVADALTLLGLLGLARSGVVTGRVGVAGVAGAVLGRLLFLAAEIHALVLGNDETPLLPVATMLTAAAMVLTGIAVLRSAPWAPWRRSLPLAIGVYPFIFMIPFAATNPEPPMFAVAGWGVLWALLGLALRQEAVPTQPGRTAQRMN